LPVSDATAHPASFALIETTPHACALIRGKGILEARLSNRTFSTDGFRRSTGELLFGFWEEDVTIYAVAGRLTPPADVWFQCEFSQSQRKPSLLSESL
jgi:hypothetical protein